MPSQRAADGIGIGDVDAHLLAAARLTPGAQLWTLDERLRAAASQRHLAFAQTH